MIYSNKSAFMVILALVLFGAFFCFLSRSDNTSPLLGGGPSIDHQPPDFKP